MHGYEVTRATHRHLADRSDVEVYEGPAWDPFPGRHTPSRLLAPWPLPRRPPPGRPAPPLPPASLLRSARGGRRRMWSTMFDLRDWPTYVYAVLAVILFVWLPIRVSGGSTAMPKCSPA